MTSASTNCVILLLALVTPYATAEPNQLPDMGDSAGTLISPAQERKLGQAFFRSLRAQIDISDDPQIQHYIQSIGQKLVTSNNLDPESFHFFVVMNKQINAFAGPGGYIGINSGLFTLTKSESELASVMAHEIAHVTQRHLHRAFEEASKLSVPTAAATLGAVLLGLQSPQLAQAAVLAIRAGSIQHQIDFTRANEKEADSVGMALLASADFDPRRMPVFFDRLLQENRHLGQNIPEFLRTHPVSTSRIADTMGRANKYPKQQYTDSLDYLLTRAKLRVLHDDNALHYFQSSQAKAVPQQVKSYGVGLAQLKSHKYDQARQILQGLASEYPGQPQYAFALIDLATASNNQPKALQLLEAALAKFPDYDALQITMVKTLLLNNKPQQAKTILQSLPDTLKGQPLFYQLLAKSYNELGQTAQSHRYLAEYYYQSGQTNAAISQLNLAKKAKGINFFLAAILDERLLVFTGESQDRVAN